MLAGAAGGWVQDVGFGGGVVGLSGLTKVLVGFGVGLAGSRFQLTEPAARVLVLFAATLVDALIFERLASAFDVRLQTLSLAGLFTRAVLNAALGGVLFFYADRYVWRRRRS
jgi:cell shape-determining protein MreD